MGTEGVLESIGGVVKLIDKDGEQELPLLPAEDVFEQFLRRTKGEDVGVSPEDSFYMTEVALRAEEMALEKKKSKIIQKKEETKSIFLVFVSSFLG